MFFANGSFSGRTTCTRASTTPSIIEIVRERSCAIASMKRMRSSLGLETMPVFLKTSPTPLNLRRGMPRRSQRFAASAKSAWRMETFHVPSSPGCFVASMPASRRAAMTAFACDSSSPE